MKNTLNLVCALSTATFFTTGAFAQQTTLTKPNGNITNGSFLAGYPGSNAFNQNKTADNSRWLVPVSAMNATPNTAFVVYSFDDKTVVNGYAVFGLASSNSGLARDPKSWSLEGSSNKVDWVLADARSNVTGWTSLQVRSYATAHTNSFRHWRFTMHENNGATDHVGIQELELDFFGKYLLPCVLAVVVFTAYVLQGR